MGHNAHTDMFVTMQTYNVEYAAESDPTAQLMLYKLCLLWSCSPSSVSNAEGDILCFDSLECCMLFTSMLRH